MESGVTHLVASPGFRNSPLLLAARMQEGLKIVPAVDERGAGFLALGISQLGAPVAALPRLQVGDVGRCRPGRHSVPLLRW